MWRFDHIQRVPKNYLLNDTFSKLLTPDLFIHIIFLIMQTWLNTSTPPQISIVLWTSRLSVKLNTLSLSHTLTQENNVQTSKLYRSVFSSLLDYKIKKAARSIFCSDKITQHVYEFWVKTLQLK